MNCPETFRITLCGATLKVSRIVKAITLCMIYAVLTCGCPHVNSGLPPPLRYPVIEADSPATGLYHTVVESETLPSIAKSYNADQQQLAEMNNLRPPYGVQANTRLFIPGASRQKKTETNQTLPQGLSAVQDFPGIVSWPVEGKIISEFGIKGGIQHNGISIETAEGTPVKAAQDGKVGYVGSIPGYGNVILIEHANRLVTVYGHLKEIKTGTRSLVKRGDVIGTVGSSGRVVTPCLYFEVRSRSKPRNPLFFLTRKT